MTQPGFRQNADEPIKIKMQNSTRVSPEDQDQGGQDLEDQDLVQLSVTALRRSGQRAVFRCLGRQLSGAELDRLSDAFARWLLHECHLRPGERVALQLPNLLQYPVAALGVLKARGVVVNVNPLYTAPELRLQLCDSDARILVVFANTAANAAQIVAQTPVECVVVTELGDLLGWPRGPLLNLAARHLRGGIKPYAFARKVAWREALALGRRHQAQGGELPGPQADDLALLQYTGGTTGVVKAAMLTHRNLVSNVLQVSEALGANCPPPGALIVAPLPLYHVYAFTMNFLMALHQGHETVLIPNPRDIDGFVATLKKLPRIDGFAGINTLYKLLCEHPRLHEVDFSALKIASSGGMALSRQVADAWLARTGCRILEGYGLSECSPVVSCNRYEDYRSGSVGRPLPRTEVCLKTSSGALAMPGEPGEVCVKGPQVMLGYWRRQEENARVFDADGWLHTGDLAVADASGYLRIVDRLKDLIIISGFNVFPNEIEEQACTHPDISDACAIAVGDECAAQIKLFVVSRNARLSAQDVISHCRQALAAYKVPRLVEFRETLPKSNVGKVLRRQLREPLTEQS
ncbi:MAG: AMP-binding protein [Pseudomonadales bacterium]|jgi:long-chain acyl-CoA synthetase|nr:AMP-binding protein [Pseudomonadales bacterium]